VLTPMDDTLWHQLPTTFDHVGTSDPRFFDRYWFTASDPNGAGTLQFTLGAYQNMNVMDGGFVAIRGGRQHNLRVSRALRPRYETACGPLRVEVVEPLERVRLFVDPGSHGIEAELEWIAILPAQEEAARFTRVRGRIVEESRRFDQIGACNGWLSLPGEVRIELDDWWATRDHSWGVRERLGIEEPVTGPAAPPSAGSLFAFLFFSTDSLGGHVQLAQFSGRPDYFTAEITRRGRGGETIEAHLQSRASLDVSFHDDASPRRFRTARFDTSLPDGSEVQIQATALGPSVDMQGLGYGGYDDQKGLGVYRGEEHVEHDIWDVSHPTDVIRPDGKAVRPIHRIQPVRVSLRGGGLDGEGTGSLTMIAEGDLPQLGLGSSRA